MAEAKMDKSSRPNDHSGYTNRGKRERVNWIGSKKGKRCHGVLVFTIECNVDWKCLNCAKNDFLNVGVSSIPAWKMVAFVRQVWLSVASGWECVSKCGIISALKVSQLWSHHVVGIQTWWCRKCQMEMWEKCPKPTQNPEIEWILIGGHLWVPRTSAIPPINDLGGQQNSTSQNPKNSCSQWPSPTPSFPLVSPLPCLAPLVIGGENFLGFWPVEFCWQT